MIFITQSHHVQKCTVTQCNNYLPRPQLFPNTNQWEFLFELTILSYSIIEALCPDLYLFTFPFSSSRYHFWNRCWWRSWSHFTLKFSHHFMHLRHVFHPEILKIIFFYSCFLIFLMIYILSLAQIDSGTARAKL